MQRSDAREYIYDNLWTLFQEMRQHVNQHESQLLASDIQKRLLLGWVCQKTGDGFFVRLSQVRARKALNFPFEYENKEIAEQYLTKLIVDREGRQTIAKLLSYDGPNSTLISAIEMITRAAKLKAFW